MATHGWLRTALRLLYLAPSIYLGGLMLGIVMGPGVILDFTVFRTAVEVYGDTPLRIYDVAAMTALQVGPDAPPEDLRPFAYPPTAMALVWWTGQVGHDTALWAWRVVSITVFVGVVWWTFAGARVFCVLAALTSYIAATAFGTGQMSFLVAAGVIAALRLLDTRPALAGVLLAGVALVKPPVVLLAPVALAAGGHWRTLGWAIGAGTAALALSVAVQGIALWQAWVAALPEFLDVVRQIGLFDRGMGSQSLAMMLGLSGETAAVFRAGLAALAALLCWLVFARTRALPERLVALAGFSLLAAPYALHYDWLVVLPAAAWIFFHASGGWRQLALGLVAYAAFFPLPGIPWAVAAVTATFVLAISAHVLWRRAPAHREA